jgi:hypothetical protein
MLIGARDMIDAYSFCLWIEEAPMTHMSARAHPRAGMVTEQANNGKMISLVG